MTFYFDMPTVAKLIAHAQTSTVKVGVFAQKYDSNFKPKSNPAIPPGLIWVKDDEVYLMSNGKLPAGQTARSLNLICHAVGFNPRMNADYDHLLRNEIGGDDFAEFVALERLGDEILGCRHGYLAFTVTEDDFQLGWTDRI